MIPWGKNMLVVGIELDTLRIKRSAKTLSALLLKKILLIARIEPETSGVKNMNPNLTHGDLSSSHK